MYQLKFPGIYASEIAGFLNSTLRGNDFLIKFPASLNNFKDQSFFFLPKNENFPQERLKPFKNVLLLTEKEIPQLEDCASYIVVSKSRIAFMKVVNEFYVQFDVVQIAPSANIHEHASLGRGVYVGEHAVIGPDVSIGNNTKVLNNVVISGRVKIGDNCLIKDNTTIGSEGFDFDYDEEGRLIHSPQIGKIIIGNNAWIGANSSIESSTIDNTVIEDNVKIDDLVQIGGHCTIQKATMITAGVIISRQVTIGQNCLLCPNVSVREFIKIEDNVTVGIGSVVVKDLPANGVYVGNPAKLLRKKGSATC